MNCKGNSLTARDYMLNAAIATDDRYKALRHIYSDGAMTVATNGKVLCYAPMDLPVGFYDMATAGTGRNKTTRFVPLPDCKELVFPNWKAVVPDCTKAVKTFEFAAGSDKVEREIFKLQFALASLGTGSLIAQEYIDLMRKTVAVYHVSIIDGMSPVVFDASGFFTLIVMPRREKDNTEINGFLDAFKTGGNVPLRDVSPVASLSRLNQESPRVESQELEQIAADVSEPMDAVPVDSEEPAEIEPPEAEPETRQDAPETAKKPRKEHKPSFRYVCELASGETVTLASVREVEARDDVVKCRIEPVKKQRKAA